VNIVEKLNLKRSTQYQSILKVQLANHLEKPPTK